MQKLGLTFVSVMSDMRLVTPWLVGGYWLLIILLIAYWVFFPSLR